MKIIKRNMGVVGFYLVLIIGTMFLIYENDRYQMQEKEENLNLIVQK